MGLTYQLSIFKIGGSFLLPYTVRGEAKLGATLPSSPVFDRVRLDGDRAQLSVPFPAIVRVGLELSPMEPLRFELSGVYEGWSRQQEIVATPKDVWMRGLLGIGDYQVGPIRLQRDMQDVWSLRLGGEYRLSVRKLSLRAGAAYENGAFSDRTLSPLTLDSDKWALGGGAGIQVAESWTLDLTFGHVFIRDRNVRTSELTQPSAIRPTPSTGSHIANGRYRMEATFAGAGITWRR